MRPTAHACWLILFAVGCGPTQQDVVEQYRPRFEAKRRELKEIAELLRNRQPDSQPVRLDLEPRPFMDTRSRLVLNPHNTEFLMFEQLEKPDAAPPVDLLLSEGLAMGLRWTGPRNPMDAYDRKRRFKEFPQYLENALTARYLVVHRVEEYTPPKVIDEKTFSPGKMTLAGFLVDPASKTVLGSYSVSAVTDSHVDYSASRTEAWERRQAAVHSSLFVNARRQVAGALTKLTGGKFNLD